MGGCQNFGPVTGDKGIFEDLWIVHAYRITIT